MPVSEKHKRLMQSLSEHSKSPIIQKHVCSLERSWSSKTQSRSLGNIIKKTYTSFVTNIFGHSADGGNAEHTKKEKLISKNSKLGLNAGVKTKEPICTYPGWMSIMIKMSLEQRSLLHRRHGRAECIIPSKYLGDLSMTKSIYLKLGKMKRELESESSPRATRHQNIYGKK